MSHLLILDGMSCQHCVNVIEQALKAVPGVTSVDVSLERHQARVEGNADVAELVEAVKGEGYTATQA
jgi:copper chaperone